MRKSRLRSLGASRYLDPHWPRPRRRFESGLSLSAEKPQKAVETRGRGLRLSHVFTARRVKSASHRRHYHDKLNKRVINHTAHWSQSASDSIFSEIYAQQGGKCSRYPVPCAHPDALVSSPCACMYTVPKKTRVDRAHLHLEEQVAKPVLDISLGFHGHAEWDGLRTLPLSVHLLHYLFRRKK